MGDSRQFWLRPMELEDIPVVTGWLQDVDDLAMFDRRLPVPLDSASMEMEWRDSILAREPRASYWFMIRDDDDGNVGMAGLANISYANGNALMPMFIDYEMRSKGIGVRVRALLLDLAFQQLRLVRITSLHRIDNIASRKINEACGFQHEGCIRSGCYSGGVTVDQSIYGMLAEEWSKNREKLRAKLSTDVVVTLSNRRKGSWSWPATEAAKPLVRQAR